MTRGGRMLSTRISAAITALTAGDGPLVLGVCWKSLTLTELEEYLEAAGPVSPTDTSGIEKATRGKDIRLLGLLIPSGDGTTAGFQALDVGLKGLRFTEEGAGWQWFAYNISRALTTGSTLRIVASSYVEFNPSG